MNVRPWIAFLALAAIFSPSIAEQPVTAPAESGGAEVVRGPVPVRVPADELEALLEQWRAANAARKGSFTARRWPITQILKCRFDGFRGFDNGSAD